jgi:hypothetical protein
MWMGVNAKPQPLCPRWRVSFTHCTGYWVGPRAGLDECEKSRPTGIRCRDRPARSQPLYWLRQPSKTLNKHFQHFQNCFSLLPRLCQGRVKRRLLLQKSPRAPQHRVAGNMLPVSYGLSRPVLLGTLELNIHCIPWHTISLLLISFQL